MSSGPEGGSAVLGPVDRLRLAAGEVDSLADSFRQDAIRTGELGGTVLATLLAPDFAAAALVSPISHADAVVHLAAVETLATAHAARAMGRWTFLAELSAAFQASDAMLAAALQGGVSPVDAAWRALLSELQLGIAVQGPAWDAALGTATAVLVGAGVPLAPKLPPETSYPADWGDRDARIEDFRRDLAEVYGEDAGYPPAGMVLDSAHRIVPLDTESLFVSAAQAAKLGAPSAGEADGSVIRVVTYPTEPPTFVALIPGSAGFGFESPSDWVYNATGGQPLQAAARDALDRAIAAHGAEAGMPRVGVAGFSQGGIAALGLGASLGPGYDLAFIETAGTPDLEDVILPSGTRVVGLADPDDPVPELDGRANPSGWEQVAVDSGGLGFAAHNELRYAHGYGSRDDDPIAALVTGADGAPTMTDYFYVMR